MIAPSGDGAMHRWVHDLIEVQFRSDLVFEIKLLLREPVPQFGNLSVGQGIFNRDPHLLCNLSKKLEFVLRERLIIPAAQT